MIVPHLELGGADKFNLDLITCLQRDHGYEVTVVATIAGNHPWRHCFEQLTPDVYTLETFLPVAEHPRFLAYLINSRSPDVVLITNSQMGYQLLPFLRAECPGPAFADYIHMEEDDWKSGNYPRYSLNYQPFLDSTIVASEHLRNWMLARGGDPERIHVCTINVDPDLWSADRCDVARLRAKYGIEEGTPVITYAARLCVQKQPDILALTIKALRDRGARFHCLVAGDGEYRPWLEEFIHKHDLRELRLLGAKSSEEIREILAISDIYFMPSKMEGISLAIYEAMAMGAVPVSADVGGQSELVSPECGIMLRRGPNEVLAYTEALVRLLGDHAQRTSMAVACRRRILERFTLRDMGARMAGLMEEAGKREFDLAAAFQAWRWTLATEVVEQRRCEKAIETLWSDRKSRPEIALQGGPSVIPKLILRSGVSLQGLLQSMLLILSPRNFVLKLRNLNLLRQAVSDPAARARLDRLFDAAFYAQYEDIRQRKIMPLLHYAVQGYLERRSPSARFDTAEVLRSNPAIAKSGVNPLLWSVLHTKS
jgi:glycosyltransferase involved in cell wall biosynthesis